MTSASAYCLACGSCRHAAGRDLCAKVGARVVIGAPYVSGSRSIRATSTEATATTVVRAQCTRTGHPVDLTPGSIAVSDGTASLLVQNHQNENCWKIDNRSREQLSCRDIRLAKSKAAAVVKEDRT